MPDEDRVARRERIGKTLNTIGNIWTCGCSIPLLILAALLMLSGVELFGIHYQPTP